MNGTGTTIGNVNSRNGGIRSIGGEDGGSTRHMAEAPESITQDIS